MYKNILVFLLGILSYARVIGQCNCLSTEPINSGLIACYPFNGNANDQTSNGNHGVVNGAVLTTDRFGTPNSAYYFDGINDGIDVTRSQTLEPTSAMSACAWVYKEFSNNAWTPILSKRYSIPDPYNSYSMDGGDGIGQKWMVNVCRGTVGSQKSVFSKTSRPYNQWEFVVMVYNGSSLKMYINGKEENSLNVSGNIGYSNMGFYIGKNTVYDQFFKGKIDDVRLYNRALSSCEIRYLYNNCTGQIDAVNLIQDTLKTICANDSVQLLGQNAISYTWSPSISLSNPNIPNPIAFPKVTTLYRLVAGDSACTFEDEIWVVVKNKKLIIKREETICANDSVMLQVSGGQGYIWSYSNTLSDITIANPYANPKINTTYYLTANVDGCMVKDSVKVTIANNITAQAGSDTSLCKGSALQLNATGGSRFAWSPNIEINDTTINNPTITATQSRWYKVQSTSGTCEAKDSLFVTVNDNPTIHANDTIVCGLNNVFTPIINATAADNYLWQPSTYLSSANLKYPQISPKSSIAYIIKANNSTTGCSALDTMFVLLGNPVADFTTPVPIVIIPETVSLTNSSNPNNLNYAWYLDETYFANTKHSQVNVNEEKSYHIKLVVTDSLGCMDSTTKLVEGKSNAKIFIPNVFTPNGDNANDVFSISFVPGLYLNFEGSIWNRWGQQITTFDALKGNWWDGTFEGKFCPDGVYFYIINTTNINNESKTYWGTLTLIR